MTKELEIYLHIPFCLRKCQYCDFLSFAGEESRYQDYRKALEAEAENCLLPLGSYQVSTVFFGGGTPSLLPGREIGDVLAVLRRRFPFRPDAEITLEANPGTVTGEKLRAYRQAGVNRLSLGCQSTDNRELKYLGRIHSYEDFLRTWHLACEAGFTNRNVDLMSGLPGQTVASWERSLRQVAELGPEHISAYSLILEEGTPFYQKRETLNLPGEEEERLMYERTHEILEEYGYCQYEISNYAKPGRACRHNLGYWRGTEYLGLGLGASSLLGHSRYRNTDDFSFYLEHSADTAAIRQETERLSLEDQQAEYMILGLRLMAGVSVEEFERRFGRRLHQVYGSVIEKYQKLGLLEEEEGMIRLTRRGISLSNTVMADFLP
jgi:oxygen-independent coproporphyrinogen III oxidase